MSEISYFRSMDFRVYAADWITAVLTSFYVFFMAQRSAPVARQFVVSDLSLAHPIKVHETVSANFCLVLITFLPGTVIFLTRLLYERPRSLRLSAKFMHEFQVAVLGLTMSLVICGAIVDTLKNWIGRPRPDLLARCVPAAGTPTDVWVDVSVCTAPLGMPVLLDGFRSAPSGHSALSFACLGYLSLWLAGQAKLLQSKTPHLSSALFFHAWCAWPLVLATYIALSRTMDYRHHFTDVFSGAGLGTAVACLCYHRYFPRLDSDAPHEPFAVDHGPILPQ